VSALCLLFHVSYNAPILLALELEFYRYSAKSRRAAIKKVSENSFMVLQILPASPKGAASVPHFAYEQAQSATQRQ
jgi:hypothetical protein